MKKSTLLIVSLAALTLTTKADLISAVNSTVVDTNSSYFANVKFDLYSGELQSSQNGSDAAVGGDYNFTSWLQAGTTAAFSTGSTTVDAAQGDVAYRIPVHNMEFDPYLGAGYDWNNAGWYATVGLKYAYLVHGNTSAFVRPAISLDGNHLVNRPNIEVLTGVQISF